MLKLQNLGKERPICAVDGCSNGALVYLGGDFVCGDCCVVYTNMSNKNLLGQLSQLKKGEEKNDAESTDN